MKILNFKNITPKISCFRHRNYNDIYIDNVLFSLDKLILLLDILPEQNLIALIEVKEDITPILIKKIKSTLKLIRESANSFILKCTKKELIETFKQIDLDDIEEIFIIEIKKESIPNEEIKYLENYANSMIKKGVSNISIVIIFSENEIEISLSKEIYPLKNIKENIKDIFKT